MKPFNRIPKLTLALLAASLYTAPAQAATITVDIDGDSDPQNPVGIVSPSPVGADGLCSLIGAITNANLDNQSGDIDCAAGSGDDTIVLPEGATFTLTQVNNTDDGGGLLNRNGLPRITSNISIQGNGSTIERSTAAGTPQFRLIQVGVQSGTAVGNLTLDRVTLTGGSLPGVGGGVRVTVNSNGFTMTRSTIRGNEVTGSSTSFGGGLRVERPSVISDSTISGNTSPSSSAGISVNVPTAAGTLLLSNVTISGNTALSQSAGLFVTGSATLINSTVTGNVVTTPRQPFPGAMGVNGASTLGLTNSIVAGNSNGNQVGAELSSSDSPTSVVETTGVNVLGHAGLTSQQAFSGFTPAASQIVATSDGSNVPLTSILNTTLASNGGPTQTHALVSGSPAVNASGTGATTADQRGFNAVGVRDLGAYEFDGVDPNAPAPVNGACGSADGVATSMAPANGELCTTGTATAVTGSSGAWGWSCTGSNNGTTSTCAAPYASQTLTLTVSPTSITVGNAASASAQSTSALKPVLSTSTPTVCEVGTAMNTSTGVQAMVGGNTAGTCTVLANHPGTGDVGEARFLAAVQVSATLTVTAAPPAGGSACEAFATGTANVIDLRSSPGGATARGVNGRFNVIYGSAFADNLTGGNAGNCIDGGAGNDRLTAGAGANHLYGSEGNDTLTPAGGSNAMDGGAGTDKCGKASSRATATYTSCESN